MNKFLFAFAAVALILANVILYSCNNSRKQKTDTQTASMLSSDIVSNSQNIQNEANRGSSTQANVVASVGGGGENIPTSVVEKTGGENTANKSKTDSKEVWAKPISTEKNATSPTAATPSNAESNKKEVWARVKNPSAATTPTKEKPKTVASNTNKTPKNALVPEQEEEVFLSSKKVAVSGKTQPKAQLVFAEREYDFGTIIEGEKVQHKFEFTNKGEAPLIITDASSTCGCTIPDFPKTPIMPGQSDVINVSFDSKGKIGLQDKHVTVTTNAGTFTIHLKGVCTTKNISKE